MNNKPLLQTFHNHLDAEIQDIADKKFRRSVVTVRDLSYQFSTHYHPYAGQLMRRMIEGSVPGLQAVDTENDDGGTGGFNLLPNSILVELSDNTKVSIVGNNDRVVPAGTRVTLNDETNVLLPSGNQAQLPKKTLLFESQLLQGLKIGLEFVDFGKNVTLTNSSPMTLPDGVTATIPGGTVLKLISCKPRPKLFAEIFSSTNYNPSDLVQQPYPVEELDYSVGGAYSVYNWELFFHAPLAIAIQLSKNQRFAEAQRWLHFLFDPTDDSDGTTPERFWKVRPFQSTDVKKIEEILVNLATGTDQTLKDETLRSIEAWKDTPFRPHVIARYRQQAYMYKTVMAYLDNLIAWGDSLFRQDTGESVDEASMLYVLAANILGPRPEPVPKKGAVRPQTYANLRDDLDKFGNVMRDIETDIPFDLMPFPTADSYNDDRLATLRSLGKALYFCAPRNDKLVSYWNTIADRLFKIRNSLNIQGIFRQLPLFEPPLDPGMLARATAAGLDVAAIVNGLNQPLPLVRFQSLVQRTGEICQEIKSLGNSLLSAMEKEDGEALSILRTKHERTVMEMAEHVKYAQVQEAIKSKEGLLQSLALAVQRFSYYESQLGKKSDEITNSLPELVELDADSLDKMKLVAREPSVALRDIEIDIVEDLGVSGGKLISKYERDELLRLESARKKEDEAASLAAVAKFLSLIPEFGAQAEPMGVGAAIKFGGQALSTQFSLAADGSKTVADQLTYQANKAAKIGGYARREQEWAFQSNLAAGEITQIFKQLRAAQIRQAIAEQELKNHRQQMKQAEEIERFLNEEGTEKSGKKTNRSLYAWMKGEVKGLYGQCFQFAFDIAKKAERALQHELGKPELNFIQFGYLAGKEGLLAGEKLYFDVKRMEMTYHELNQREYELTKHVSLLQVDPVALIRLRAIGRCTVLLPEALFDMDGPGHYFRRIKTLAVSIPCVTGPYANVNCTLTVLKSSIRKSQVLRDGVYAREDAEDDRFNDYFSSLQSIVTSSAQSDSGLFETNLHDERYLPFENSGVISEWQLQLPANPSKNEPCLFDYDAISDVILHIRYTARDGGGLLRKGAMDNLKSLIDSAEVAGSVRLFAIRQEFPSEWLKFQSQIPDANQRPELSFTLTKEHYPFWSKDRLRGVKSVDVLARSTAVELATTDIFDKADKTDLTSKKDSLTKREGMDTLLIGKFENIALPIEPTGRFTIYFDKKDFRDVWVAVTWKGKKD